MVESGSAETVLRLTAQIVAAHVEHNTVQAEALPGLIEKVYQTLRDVGQAPVEVGQAGAGRFPSSSRSRPTSSFAWRTARNSRC